MVTHFNFHSLHVHLVDRLLSWGCKLLHRLCQFQSSHIVSTTWNSSTVRNERHTLYWTPLPVSLGNTFAMERMLHKTKQLFRLKASHCSPSFTTRWSPKCLRLQRFISAFFLRAVSHKLLMPRSGLGFQPDHSQPGIQLKPNIRGATYTVPDSHREKTMNAAELKQTVIKKTLTDNNINKNICAAYVLQTSQNVSN